MANYDVTIYNSLYEAEQALEGIDNATDIVAIPFKDGVLTKVMVMQGTSDANDVSLSGVTNSTLSALKVIEQAPLDQQVLDETLLDAVTSTGASTDVYTLDKNGITIEITASSVSTGGTIKIQGTSDNTNYGDLGVDDNTGTISQSITIDADGTYYYEVVNASSVKYMRANLSSRTDGTYTVKMTGRA